MHYSDGAMWRPLFETTEAMLQTVEGCSHNKCKFCTMFKGTSFCLSNENEILEDINEMAHASWKNPDRVFLTGGNAFCLSEDRLQSLIKNLRVKMPGIKTVGCFARIEDVSRKTDSELKKLANLGLTDISIGAESGLDEALSFMSKGHTASDIIEQCKRLDAANMAYDLFFLAGIAGAGNFEKNARATAEVFSQTNPRRVMIHTLTLFPGCQLLDDVERGTFTPSSEVDVMREIRMFVQLLDIETFILGAHIGNTVPFNASIPQQRDDVLQYLDTRIERADEKRLTHFRKHLKSM